jgi:spermidine/putrescine transport system substrate-binding protein
VKKIVSFMMILVLCAGIAGCGLSNNISGTKTTDTSAQNAAKQHEQDRKSYKEVLRVYNAAEYIDESTIVDFEKEYKIRVEYAEFESNETLYNDVSGNLGAYDVLVPSDYMVDRLIKEGKLAKIDRANVPNIANVAAEYLAPAYDAGNEYTVPYMVGTVGLLYNKKKVSAPIESWSALFDAQYKGKVLLWDSQRDVIGATLKLLGYSMNSSKDSELSAAQTKLSAARASVQYGGEEMRDKMIAGEGVVALVYSGEAKSAIDQNPNLAYSIPKEGSNKWVDGFVVMKNSTAKAAAEKFINFMCRPNIAVRNMTQTGYTSPIKGAWAEFGNNQVMFPTAEELARCEAFLYDASAAQKYNSLWAKVK